MIASKSAYELAKMYMSGEMDNSNGNAGEIARVWGASDYYQGKVKFVTEFDSKDFSGVDADTMSWLTKLRDEYTEEIVTYQSFLVWIRTQQMIDLLG